MIKWFIDKKNFKVAAVDVQRVLHYPLGWVWRDSAGYHYGSLFSTEAEAKEALKDYLDTQVTMFYARIAILQQRIEELS